MPPAVQSEEAIQRLPTLHDFFSPGGILAKSSLAFEQRPGQYLMARTIEQAFADRRHLIVEAGTGTGKTLAYLLPALRRARENNQRIIISTGTKNLQEQLYFKDIPFLESLLGPLRVCYMKGRANYVCKHKLFALRDNPLLHGLDEISHFHSILNWEKKTATGDRAEIADLPESSALWHKLDARSEVCLGQSCPDWEQCYITSMRRKAMESEIVIVNHHLFFADLNIKQQAAGAPDAGILPEAAAVIFDEAHELEDVASQYFGIALSNARFDELARDTEMLLRAKKVSTAAIESATNSLRERSRMFFGSLPVGPSHLGRLEFIDRQDFLEARGDAYIAASNALQRLESELDHLRDVDEAPGLRKRAADIRNHLKFLLESTDPNTVFWIERRATSGLRTTARNNRGPSTLSPLTQIGTPTDVSSRPERSGVERPAFDPPQSFSTHLQATPIDVSQLLADTLFATYPSVILTSATLTVAGPNAEPSFDHLTKRLGVPFPKTLVVPSLFDYPRQALLYLPATMPEPRHPDFLPQATEKIRRVLEITRGRAFCLFTSHAQMRELHDRLLSQLPYPLLMQGSAPRHVLLQQFRETPNAVLFGTSSFWQGIDVQGEQLSCVIIDKLPFAVPSDPIMRARTEAIAAAGGNAFNDLQVPQAVIALKQGFGRLIRSLSDRGVLMLLDPRIRTTRYGKTFLESLPPYRRTDDIAEVERFFET
ncbi:DEAD/DEAH box helicase [Granulicella sp. 5B5]|uniref:ATP-dependent DNA helicase n=1 Tax=Granulicella sp. 5B5 TaxID=1617967 RepID=UPI0015F5599B|nr:helicase C-terminal domain-containing protein [Granulicella sp. 5B5]QMV19299.1 DEAD/DEAH box helicase [Granulicella sp. 5B5]